jgi:hypothetical protein
MVRSSARRRSGACLGPALAWSVEHRFQARLLLVGQVIGVGHGVHGADPSWSGSRSEWDTLSKTHTPVGGNRLTGRTSRCRTRCSPRWTRLSGGPGRPTADGREYTLADTVCFVRHLPHQLVEAFRSTLEEVVDADLVLHVVDASAGDAMAQVTTVRGVLYEIGARDHTDLLALNEVDVAPPEWVAALGSAHPAAAPVSALTGEGIEDLRTAIARALPRR